MDWCWYSCCAYGDWCHPDSSEFTDSEAIRKNVSETERHILGETSQWAGNTDPAVLHIGLFGKVQMGHIFCSLYNGKDGNSALFVAAIFVHIFINIRPLLVSLGTSVIKNEGVIFI